MSAVEILASGAQARSGASDAFDATAFSTLRLDLTTSADMGVQPSLRLWVETAPGATGPWSALQEYHLHPDNWQTSTRVLVAGFDAFVRLRWDGKPLHESLSPFGANAGEAQPLTDPSFVIGLAGDGQPDAA